MTRWAHTAGRRAQHRTPAGEAHRTARHPTESTVAKEATPTERMEPMAAQKTAAMQTERTALPPPGRNRAEREKREPTAQTEPVRSAAKATRSWALVRAVRHPARSAGPRAPRNTGSRWACGCPRSTSIRAAWACRTTQPTAWARGARPPLLEMDSRPRAACETRRAWAVAWLSRRARQRPRLRHWGRLVGEAEARALALDQTPEARSPPGSARRLQEWPAMPAEPRLTEIRQVSP